MRSTNAIRCCYQERYIGRDEAPEIDKLREQPDQGTRDILTLEQYEKLWRFLEYKYCKDKTISDAERQKDYIYQTDWCDV